MKILNIKILLIIIFVIALPFNVISQSVSDLKNQADSIKNQINKLNSQKAQAEANIKSSEQKQRQLSMQIHTLSAQVNETDKSIDYLELNIQKSEVDLELSKQLVEQSEIRILELSSQITRLDELINYRINDIYANTRITKGNDIPSLLDTNIEQSIINANFQEKLKINDEETFILANNKKLQEETEKQFIEEQKREQEQLNLSLKNQRDRLEMLKQTLASTINNQTQQIAVLGQNISQTEQMKEKLENQAEELSEKLNGIQSDIFNMTKAIPSSGGYVKKGTFLGYQGNTGYSTGAHLHFFVSRNGGSVEDPCKFLASGKISQCKGNGTLSWPMTKINWSRGFSNGHSGIDIYAFSNTEIYAAHDGYVMRGKEPCYPFFPICNNGGANYVVICESQNCKSGFKTGYWHLR